MLKVRCPGCGKSATVPETDAGLLAVCLACGERYTVPEPTPPAEAGPAAADVQLVDPGMIDPPVGGALRWLAAAAALTILLGAIAAVLLAARHRPDPINASIASSYKSQAEAAAAAGQYAEAYRKYHELEQVVGGKPIRDPRTRALVEQAAADKAKVYALLLDRVGQNPQLAQATQPTPSASTTAPASDSEDFIPAPRPEGATAEVSEPEPDPSPEPIPQPARPPEQPRDAVALAPQPAPPIASEVPRGASTPTTLPQQPTAPAPDAAAPAAPPLPPVAPAAARPPIQPMPEAATGVTDEEIGRAIQAGVEHLLARIDRRTRTLDDVDVSGADGGGRNALMVYALLQCGQTLKDERLNVRGPAMDAMITAMKRSNLRSGHPQVYALALRATALALFNRPQDAKQLRADVEALLHCHTNGAYWYTADPRPARVSPSSNFPWDNSNSQYGLLGVWSGAEAGVEVPAAYWAAVDSHWEGTQTQSGQWSYNGDRKATLTMTMAGIASLFVTQDWLDAPKSAYKVGREPFSPHLQHALNWLEAGDNAVNIDDARSWFGYTVYGIERVGLASGFKYFGRHDWYREIAGNVIRAQANDGSWGDAVDTCYALLFLARGRHPILMNKLRFDGYWANRPRDAANLTRFAAHQLERELNWQVVPLRAFSGPAGPDAAENAAAFEPGIGRVPRPARARAVGGAGAEPWSDWMDSPILYLASHRPVKLLAADYDNLRAFVEAGGLLFTHADGDEAGTAFNEWIERDLAPKLFPKYELRDLPPDHPVYNLVYKIDEGSPRPKLRGVFNGARLLMLHSPTDIARAWQVRDQKIKRPLFNLGINLFLYAAGKRDLRNRLESPYVSDPGDPVNGSVGVARLEYAGNWDPEPGAWRRFARWFQRQTGTGVSLRVASLASQAIDPRTVPIAHLTGTARHDFTDAEIAAVRRYVETGGVLLVDNCGGTGPFDASVQETLLTRAFPGAKLRPLTTEDHPLFKFRGRGTGTEDLTKPRLRPYVAERVGEVAAPFSGLAAGRGRVILTPLDLTGGLLGTRTWGVAGFEPEYAQAFMKNLIFWVTDGRPEPAATTQPSTQPTTQPAPKPATQPAAVEAAVDRAGRRAS